ncbi:MAG: lysophospholipid acyltransferase family protein [Variovorax sp.]
MTVLFRLCSLLPLPLLHALGTLLGWGVFAVSPVYRRRFLANSRQAGYSFGAVRQAVGAAGRMAAELPRLWLGAMPTCTIRGNECIERARAAGRGTLILTPHQGCFEIAPQAYCAVHGPITVLYRPARQRWLAGVMAASRERPNLATAPTTLGGVRQMLKALRRGESVGLLPDQVPPQGQGVWAPYFGRNAYTMTLAARLAQQTGAALLLCRSERLPLGRGYVLHFEEVGEALDDDPGAAATQINRAMERLVRQCPCQYLWGYARYKTPRQES